MDGIFPPPSTVIPRLLVMNIIKYIQENILGNASAVVTRKLNEHLQVVAKDAYDFHDWSWLKRSHTQALTTDTIEYNLSGADDNFAKAISMFYGEEMTPLSKSCPNEEAFYKLIYNKVEDTIPTHFVPKEKINDYTWRFIIYPCSDPTLESVTYFYKKTFNISDVPLYPNPLVFVFGILSLLFAGKALEKKGSSEISKFLTLAERYQRDYNFRLISMRKEDSALTHPVARVDISDERKRQLVTARRFQNLRNWR